MRCLVLLASISLVAPQSRTLEFQRAATDQAAVSQLLSSSDPHDQAWGSWVAGQYSMRVAIPAIVQVASACIARDDRDSQLVLDIALDALIQLRAQVPAEFLQSILPKRKPQALVLLSFAGDSANNALLKMLATEHGVGWYAAADILLPRKVAGFGSALLRDLKITVHVTISKDGTVTVGGSDLLQTTNGDGPTLVIAGFPPIAHYLVTPYANPTGVVLAIGPKPVYYQRSVGPPGHAAAGSLEVSGPTSSELIGYVAALLDTDQPRLNLTATESHAVAWRDQAALDIETEVIRSEIRRRYESVIRQLRQKALLSDSEAAQLSVPRIEVVIHDKRTF